MFRLDWFGAAALVGSVIVGSDAIGAVFHVDHESTASTPNGLSWASAFPTLQEALDVAQSDDEIWVADGTYVPSEATNILYPRTATFLLLPGVKMFGGFQGLSRPGGGETLRNQRNPELYETILSGAYGDPEDDSDNLFHVVIAIGSDITHETIINGFTITLSHASEGEYGEPTDAGNPYSAGGMVIADDAWPVIARCKFVNNVVRGVLVMDEPVGPVQFLSCTFAGNVGGYGAGVLCSTASSTPEVIFVNCLAYGNAGATGAFVYTQASTTFINCTVTENECGAGDPVGGAVRFLVSGNNLIANCVMYGNTNYDGSSEEAQIANSASFDPVVRNSNIGRLNYYAGNNNIDVDPLFVNPSNDDFEIEYLSLLLNNGDESDIPPDTYDIDDDGNTAEPLPDRAMNNRQINPTDCIDIGAYEEQTAGTCQGDITGSSGVPDGVVNNLDLLYLFEVWDTPGGAADLYPASCGNGDVDTNDMYEVTNNYGNCSSFSSGGLSQEDIVLILLELAGEYPHIEDAVAEALQQLLN